MKVKIRLRESCIVDKLPRSKGEIVEIDEGLAEAFGERLSEKPEAGSEKPEASSQKSAGKQKSEDGDK